MLGGLVGGTSIVAAIGALVCGKLNDTLGRKKTLIILAVLFFVGTIGSVLAPNLAVMIPSRVILGFAVGVWNVIRISNESASKAPDDRE